MFHGKRAQLIGTKGRHGGVARIYIDGVFRHNINLHARHRIDAAVLYTTPALRDRTHSLQVRVLSRGKRIMLDAFRALVKAQ